jgi:hypothetical protein
VNRSRHEVSNRARDVLLKSDYSKPGSMENRVEFLIDAVRAEQGLAEDGRNSSIGPKSNRPDPDSG